MPMGSILEQSAADVLQTVRQRYERLAAVFLQYAHVRMDEQKVQEFVESVFLEPLTQATTRT